MSLLPYVTTAQANLTFCCCTIDPFTRLLYGCIFLLEAVEDRHMAIAGVRVHLALFPVFQEGVSGSKNAALTAAYAD